MLLGRRGNLKHIDLYKSKIASPSARNDKEGGIARTRSTNSGRRSNPRRKIPSSQYPIIFSSVAAFGRFFLFHNMDFAQNNAERRKTLQNRQ